MNFESAVEFAGKNPVSYIATIDGDQPRVRAFMLLFANSEGFYFNTGASKDFFKQVQENPKVEICYFDPEKFQMLRVSGKVEPLDDMELKRKLIEEREILKKLFKSADDPNFTLFRIAHGEGKFWTPAIEAGEAPAGNFTF